MRMNIGPGENWNTLRRGRMESPKVRKRGTMPARIGDLPKGEAMKKDQEARDVL